jgi:hypothetical protein
MTAPRWKEFERLVYELQKSLAPDSAIVTPDDYIAGHDSKIARQIDISIKAQVANYQILAVIDCKDYKNPVDVKEVGEFASVVRDVRANKGAMIASHGFTKAAIEMARTHGLDTLTFVDTESMDWKSYVAIKVLLERTWVAGVSLMFRSVATFPWEIPTNISPLELEIYGTDGTPLGKIRNVVAKKWNAGEVKHLPGVVEVSLSGDVLIELRGKKVHTQLAAIFDVRSASYFGPLPIKVTGFKDEQTGGLWTRQMTTDFIEPYKIERGEVRGWTKVESRADLSVQPMFSMGYSDVLPEGEGPALEPAEP